MLPHRNVYKTFHFLQIFDNPKVEDLLQTWLTRLAPHYQEGSALRRRTLDRLKTAYWLEQAHHKYREHEEEQEMLLSATSSGSDLPDGLYDNKQSSGNSTKKRHNNKG